MKTRMMRKIAVLVTGSALALSFPVAGAIADQGGTPHNGNNGNGVGNQGGGKPDNPGSQGKGKQHTNKGKHKGQHKQNGPNGSRSCPDAVFEVGNHRDRNDLPTEQARENGLKCGFTGGISDATN
jgi:hypothetical protein